MKIKTIFLTVGAFIINFSVQVAAQPILKEVSMPGEGEIYSQVIDYIVSHEHQKQFVIWSSEIPAELIASYRVPRQEPSFQFSRNVAGVSTELELAFFYSNLGVNESCGKISATSLSSIGRKYSSLGYLGAVDEGQLKILTNISQDNGANLSPLVVGFSKIGYRSEKQSLNALVYAEYGIHSRLDSVYGGAGFLFSKKSGKWKLVSHGDLWEGSSVNFWQSKFCE